MKCSNCGKELPDGARFCFACGAKQESLSDSGGWIRQEIPTEPDNWMQPEIPSDSDGWMRPEISDDDMDKTVVLNDLADAVTEETTQFCPHCGAKNDSDAAFCCACGKSLKTGGYTDDGYAGYDQDGYCSSYDDYGDGYATDANYISGDDVNGGNVMDSGAGGHGGKKAKAPKPPKPPKGTKKRHTGKIIGFSAGGLVIAALIVFIVIKFVGGSSGKPDDYLNYVKNGRLVSVDTEARKTKPMIYGSISDGSYYDSLVTYSEDGKYMYFLATGSSDGYTLGAVRNGDDLEEAIKVDTGVSQYWVLKSGREVVYVKDDVLYKNDLDGNKEKIASDVYMTFIDNNEKYVMWSEAVEESYTYYYRALDLKSEKVKLFDNGFVVYHSEDFQKLYATIGQSLYVIENLGEKKEIDSQAGFLGVDENGDMYYAKSSGTQVSAADLVNDDMAEKDAAMTEPKTEDFVKTELENGPDGLEKVETTDYDAYYAACSEYDDKEYRDRLRTQLAEHLVDTGTRSIYVYKNGKSELIAENATYETAFDNGLLVYKKADELPKVNLSEINYVDDVEAAYAEKLADSTVIWTYCGGVNYSLGEKELIQAVYRDSANQKGYLLAYEQDADENSENYFENQSLYEFDTAGESAWTQIAENVASVEGVFGGNIYYVTDAKDGSGDLYCGTALVDSDVAAYSLNEVEGTSLVSYAVDMTSDKLSFTLKTFDGKESKKIADDVSMYKFMDGGKAALLVDFSSAGYGGDLKLYTGDKELKQVDKDVSYIVGGQTVYHN